MTTEEFSNEFDIILQSYSVKNEFGQQNPIAFDEYEKAEAILEYNRNRIKNMSHSRVPAEQSSEKKPCCFRLLFKRIGRFLHG